MTTREFQLLLYCATSQPDVGRIAEVVREDVDWQILLDLATRHRVQPILCQTLKSVCWDIVPLRIKRQLEHSYMLNVQISLIFAAELLRLLDQFQQNGIALSAFKGIILAQLVYGDLSLRQFSDLDIIVHEPDLPKSEDILTALGYEPDFPDRDYRSSFLRYQGQYAFRHRETGISVDLHWRLSAKGEPFPLQPAEIWSRLGEVKIIGRRVPTLVLDDLVLFLAAHGTKEGWRYLNWVCDFAELLRKHQNIDWKSVLGRAQASNCLRSLQLAMVLSSTLLDAPVPAELMQEARKTFAVQQLAERAKLRLLRPISEDELSQFLTTLNTHDRLMYRLWPVATLLTTRTVGDYQAMPLPKPLWSLYYVIRPFRLAIKSVKIILFSCRTLLSYWYYRLSS
jgi:hypothetical protein